MSYARKKQVEFIRSMSSPVHQLQLRPISPQTAPIKPVKKVALAPKYDEFSKFPVTETRRLACASITEGIKNQIEKQLQEEKNAIEKVHQQKQIKAKIYMKKKREIDENFSWCSDIQNQLTLLKKR
jgi:hypothetical protein